MVDFNDIQENPEVYKQACENKNADVDIDKLIELGENRLSISKRLDSLRHQSNQISDEVKKQGKPTEEQIEKGRELKKEIKEEEAKLSEIEQEYFELLYQVPNLPSEDTPIGEDEDDNEVLKKWGTIRDFEAEGFKPKEHWEIGEELDIIDIERASKVSGTRFNYLKGKLVFLQFALIQLAFEKLSDKSFIETIIEENNLSVQPGSFVPVIPPVLINPEPFQRMARLEPKEERYYIPSDDQYLIGSAEHTLGAMHMDETFDEKDLPIRYLGYSTAFRREAGSYGKDTKGIFRVHQFDKVEMEVFSDAETSLEEQNLLVAIQEKLMQMLEIPYQVMICSTGDQGGPDARHLDIEAWLPGQNKYRETHSADLMTDYQSRRLKIKYQKKDGTKELTHMNDATAFAIGRTLIAIIENYQQKDGSIKVPEVLQKYTGFKVIK